MIFDIEWSEKAVHDLESIIVYLKTEWGDSVVTKFKNRLSRRLNLISRFPKLHKASEVKPHYRKSVINRQVSIIYSINKKSVSIVRLIDNRSDPMNLNL